MIATWNMRENVMAAIDLSVFQSEQKVRPGPVLHGGYPGMMKPARRTAGDTVEKER